jgi:hypothetical protein
MTSPTDHAEAPITHERVQAFMEDLKKVYEKHGLCLMPGDQDSALVEIYNSKKWNWDIEFVYEEKEEG